MTDGSQGGGRALQLAQPGIIDAGMAFVPIGIEQAAPEHSDARKDTEQLEISRAPRLSPLVPRARALVGERPAQTGLSS